MRAVIGMRAGRAVAAMARSAHRATQLGGRAQPAVLGAVARRWLSGGSDPGSRLVLGIETSCDETGAAVCALAADGTISVRGHAVASHWDLQRQYKGAIAARARTCAGG